MAVAALNQSGRGELILAASGDWLLIAWGWSLAVAPRSVAPRSLGSMRRGATLVP
jgi:hypothetical protein